MYIIIWKYHVRAEKRKEFERAYSSSGTWVALFQNSPAYLGSELLQDDSNPAVYFTLDRWRSKQEYETFLQTLQMEYNAIDKQCESLTEKEDLIVKGDLHAQF